MLSNQEIAEINNFLHRLQGKIVRVEISSRINIGFRQSYAVTVEKSGETYTLTSKSGEVSMFIDINQAESLTSDHSSITLLYGDNLIAIRYARTR